MNYCLNFMLNNLNTYTYDGIHEPTKNFDDIKLRLDSRTINSTNIGDIYRKIIFRKGIVIDLNLYIPTHFIINTNKIG